MAVVTTGRGVLEFEYEHYLTMHVTYLQCTLLFAFLYFFPISITDCFSLLVGLALSILRSCQMVLSEHDFISVSKIR